MILWRFLKWLLCLIFLSKSARDKLKERKRLQEEITKEIAEGKAQEVVSKEVGLNLPLPKPLPKGQAPEAATTPRPKKPPPKKPPGPRPMTPERQAIIQQALSIRKAKQEVFAGLNDEERAKLTLMAMRAFLGSVKSEEGDKSAEIQTKDSEKLNNAVIK